MPYLPINREDGGQTFLQEDTPGIAKPLLTTIPKGGFDVTATQKPVDLGLGLPSATPATTDYDAINARFGNLFTKTPEQTALEGQLGQYRSDYMKSFDPTAEETQTQQQATDIESQLTALQSTERQGMKEIEFMPASSRFADVQRNQFQRGIQTQRADVLGQLETKYKQLGLLQTKRAGLMEKAKTAIGFAESDLTRLEKVQEANVANQKFVLDYAFKLQDNQRQALSSIAKAYENNLTPFAQMSPTQQQGLINLAQQYGIDPNAVVSIVDSQVDSQMITQQKSALDQQKTLLEMEKIKKDLNLPAKLDTSIVDANNRRLLVNNQTGEVIKDLGVSEIPKGTTNDIPITPEDTRSLIGAGFTPEEITQIKSDVGQYGINEVLAGVTDPAQKTAIQKVYGVEPKVTREQITSIVTQKMAQDGLKQTYTDDELSELARNNGFSLWFTGKAGEIEKFLASSKAKELYEELLYEQYKTAGMAL